MPLAIGIGIGTSIEGVGGASSGPLEWSPIGDVFPVKAYYNPGTQAFSTDYDAADYNLASATKMYVDTATGSDANDGLSTGAKKATIAAAITAATSGMRIEVTAGRYNEAPPTITAKNLSIIAVGGFVVWGLYWLNSEITWASVATNRWRATPPATNPVSTFVDMQRLRNGLPRIAMRLGTAMTPNDGSAAGFPICQRGSANGILLADDERNLTNTADTEIVIPKEAASALTLASAASVYLYGVVLLAKVVGPAGTQFVAEHCSIPSVAQTDDATAFAGTSILNDCTVGGSAGDAVDYSSATSIGVEIACHMTGGVNGTNGLNGSTGHSTAQVLRINSTYGGGDGCTHDVGSVSNGVSAVSGGCTYGGFLWDAKTAVLLGQPAQSNIVVQHMAGATFLAGSTLDIFVGDGSTLTDYDGSTTGKVITLEGTGAITTGSLPS